MPKLLFVVGSLWLLLVYQPPSCLAVEQMFLFIDGIPGDSNDPGHPGWSDVTSASWGNNPGSAGSTATVPGPSISVVKAHTSSSALLAQAALAHATGRIGTPFKEVKLETISFIGTGPKVVNRVKLTNVLITHYATSISTGSPSAETLSFSFATISWFDNKISNGQVTPGSAGCIDLSKPAFCTPKF